MLLSEWQCVRVSLAVLVNKDERLGECWLRREKVFVFVCVVCVCVYE